MSCLLSYIISCLAHIINLATQALIATHSKSNHYDPQKPDEDYVALRDGQFDPASDDDADGPGIVNQRDEIGLMRTITVKVSYTHPLHCRLIYIKVFIHDVGALLSETKTLFP